MRYYFPLTNLYFTAIPKSGCTSALNFLWAVEEALGASSTAPVISGRLRYFEDPAAVHQAALANYAVDLESGVPSTALRVIVLRNSMDRVASCWKDKLLLGQESNIVVNFLAEPWFPNPEEMHSADDLARMFVEFLDALEKYPQVLSANGHWNSQLDQANPLETYDIVLSTKLLGTLPHLLAQRGGRLSRLGSAKMPKFHETSFVDARLFMSNDATRLASAIYSTDDEAMMRFGVAYDSRVIRSWKQEPILSPETTRLVVPAIRRISEVYREHWLSLQDLEKVQGGDDSDHATASSASSPSQGNAVTGAHSFADAAKDEEPRLISSRRLMERITAAGLADDVAARIRATPWLDATMAVAELATESEAMASALFDIPLPEPKSSVGFASDNFEREYTYSSGLQNLRTVDGAWRRHRQKQPEYRVLDFGSGTGRLLRFACELGEGIAPVGSEVNPDAVAWLRSNFPCEVLAIKEPSLGGLGDLKFDLIYAWSIFSHFNEAAHVDWLSCLISALNPGGMLFATVHSVNNSKRLREDETYRDHFRMSLADVDRLAIDAEAGFSFFEVYDTDESAHHGIDARRFGQAFVSEEFLRTTWSQYGLVREVGEAVPGWQDYVLLQAQ